jgi:two-component system LytT family response regulator
MKKIPCIILEDEEILLQHLVKYVSRIEFLELMATFQSPVEALNFLDTNPVDLIFLDLQMPNEEIDGLAFMNILGNDFHYILTTAHPQYALQSYEYNVVDYLHKPYPFERFLKAAQKAHKLIRANSHNVADNYLYIKVGKTYQKVSLTDICWFESNRNIIRAFTEQDEITFVMTMEDLMAQLPETIFLRVQRSYIVAIDKINLIHEDYVLVNRKGDEKSIRVGDMFRSGLKGMLEGRVLKVLRK